MQEYVKLIFLKRLVKVICDKKEVSYQQLQELTGLPEEYLDNLLLMLGNYVEELELPDEGLCYKATDDTYMLLTVEDDFWKTLPGFDRLKMFEREIKILTKEDPLLFLAKTVSKVHKGDKKLIVLAILSALSPWAGSEIINLFPVGRSGKGKSSLCASTLLIMPSWAKETISSTSPLAPYYAIKRGLLNDNKVLYFDDVKTNPVFIEVIKTFSGGMKIRPRHWTVDERRRFIDIKPEHRYSIWLTSVNPIADDQLKNRFVLANVDESLEQDKRVWKYLDEIYRKAKEKSIIEDSDFQIAQNVVNILIQEPAEVIVPFKVQFPILFDRRSYIYFIVAVKVAAFIHKFQRKVINGKIIATRQDFEVARKIWQEIGRYQFLKIDADSYRILSVLGVGPENGLTYSEIMEKVKEKFGVSISRQKIARRCQKDLTELNLVSGEKIGTWRWWINEELSLAVNLDNIKSFEAKKEDLEEFGIEPTEENLKYVNQVEETELIKFMEEREND